MNARGSESMTSPPEALLHIPVKPRCGALLAAAVFGGLWLGAIADARVSPARAVEALPGLAGIEPKIDAALARRLSGRTAGRVRVVYLLNDSLPSRYGAPAATAPR